MTMLRRSVLTLLLLGALPIAEAGNDVAWVSYRDAYRTMLRFEKYGKPKQWLQNQFQLVPRQAGVSVEGLQLHLTSPTLRLALPLDAGLRTRLPFLKAAYDENAVLTLNRDPDQFFYQSLVSVVPRADGVYDLAQVGSACEQVFQYRAYLDASFAHGKRCTGLELIYAPGALATTARFRAPNQEMFPIPATRSGTVAFRWADWPAQGQLVLPTAPLLILALIE